MSELSPLSGQPATVSDSGTMTRSEILAGKRREHFVRICGYLVLAIAFPTAVWLSGKAGVYLAMRKLPGIQGRGMVFPDGQALTLGSRNEPLYLADSPESLRKFYLEYPEAESRADARELNTYGMRRVFGELEVTVQRYDADAVQVKISSGSISGAIYWVHISLLQDIPGQSPGMDEIISPIPSR